MARSLLAAAAAGLVLVHGTPHADRLSTANGKRDLVTCGGGRDVLVADVADRFGRDCETVSLRLSVDTTTGPAQHRTQVEPSAAGFGSTAVAVFQVGRFGSGGAEAIGFATSRDAGRTWRSGLLPALTVGGGPWARASDPVVAFDAVHGVWLAATLALSSTRNSLTVSRSPDAVSWSPPVVADDAPVGLAYDKEWLACDNWPGSPHRGACYLQWTDVRSGGLASQVSTDGGLTWSAPLRITAAGFGAQPVVRPDGSVVTVLLTDAQDALLATRSTDGGATFTPPLQIADVQFANVRGLRAPPLPTVAADAAGNVLAVWSDCRFRPQCNADDLAAVDSADGIAWGAPARIAAGGAGASLVVPGLGAGPAGRFAVTYYASGFAETGVRTAQSLDAGRTWSAPRRLDARPMANAWLPVTEGGSFVGDYIATAFVSGRPLPIFSLAVAARSQSIFAGFR